MEEEAGEEGQNMKACVLHLFDNYWKISCARPTKTVKDDFVEAAKIQPASAWISNKETKCNKQVYHLSHFTFYAEKNACILLQIRSFNRTNGTVEIICKGVVEIKEEIKPECCFVDHILIDFTCNCWY